ncbi:MAG: Ig-like domain-containing protein, partial [Terriglobia bacterium]
VKNFPINFGTHTLALQDRIIPINNRPALQYRFGVEHKHSDSLTYRFGYYYDLSPLPAKDVGILQPDSNRHGLTAGVSLPMPRILPFETTMDLNYLALFFTKRTVATATNVALGLAGRWDGFANVFGVGFNINPAKEKVTPVIYHPGATCTVQSPSIMQGRTTQVTALISDFDLDSVSYNWSSNGGKVSGTGSNVVFDSTDAAPGTYVVTAKVADKKGNQAMCSVNVTVEAPPKPNQNPTVTCSADRTTLIEGESTKVHASASDPDGDPLTYAWSASAGRIVGTGADVTYDSAGAAAGSTVTVSVEVSDGRGGTARCSTTLQVNAAPKPKPEPVSCLSAGFPGNSSRINNVDKACLDDVTLKMQNDPGSSLTITGFSDRSETAAKALAKRRAEATKAYLVKEKKLDANRIGAESAAPVKGATDEEKKKNRRIEIMFYPEGTKPK